MSARRGIFVFLVLLVALGGVVLFAAIVLRGSTTTVRPSTVLVYRVPTELEESGLAFESRRLGFLAPERPTVWDVVDTIDRAAEDDHVASLVLHIDDLDWGWAKVAEVRDALQRFQANGKDVYASVSGGGEREYLLASVADVVSTEPLAVLQLDGLTASALFLRGTFDKLGVTPNFASVGQYKSGVEGYTRTGMSPPARQALESLLDAHYEVLVDSLASARGFDPDSVGMLLDEGPFDADEALAYGLVDTLLYPADLDSLAARDGEHRHPTLAFNRYPERAPSGGPRIALIEASGTIAEGRSRESPTEGRILGEETILKALRDAASRKSVKAVVVRIDSPGGSAQASDQIWHEVRRCKRAKPTVVSMSDLAASGGYYVAVAADTILAQPATITGSIGVFGGKLNVMGLYHKLGLNVETVTRGRHAGMFSPFRDFTLDEQKHFQAQMEATYRTFVSRVAEGRSLDAATVDSIAQGRVWSGLDALDLHLVDRLGGLEDALTVAKGMAKIGPDQEVVVDVYPKTERTFLQRFVADLIGEDEETDTSLRFPPAIQACLAVARFPSGVTLALMPFTVDIH